MEEDKAILLDLDGFAAYLREAGNAANTISTYRQHLLDYDKCALTGYDLHTLTRWGREGKIPFRLYHNRFLISKAQLIDFLASDAYNGIVRKSEAHCKMISRFYEGSKIS